jgi:hypothetical protein
MYHYKAKVHYDSLQRVMLWLGGLCGLRLASPTWIFLICDEFVEYSISETKYFGMKLLRLFHQIDQIGAPYRCTY